MPESVEKIDQHRYKPKTIILQLIITTHQRHFQS